MICKNLSSFPKSSFVLKGERNNESQEGAGDIKCGIDMW
jgi:hypothetical protein